MLTSIIITRVGLAVEFVGAALVALDVWMEPKIVEQVHCYADKETPRALRSFLDTVVSQIARLGPFGDSFKAAIWLAVLVFVKWLTVSFARPRVFGLFMMLVGFVLQFIATFV